MVQTDFLNMAAIIARYEAVLCEFESKCPTLEL
jgi:hypothetical protein